MQYRYLIRLVRVQLTDNIRGRANFILIVSTVFKLKFSKLATVYSLISRVRDLGVTFSSNYLSQSSMFNY